MVKAIKNQLEKKQMAPKFRPRRVQVVIDEDIYEMCKLAGVNMSAALANKATELLKEELKWRKSDISETIEKLVSLRAEIERMI